MTNLAACLGFAGFAYAMLCALHYDLSDIPPRERGQRSAEILARIQRSHDIAHSVACNGPGARIAEPPAYFDAPQGWPPCR